MCSSVEPSTLPFVQISKGKQNIRKKEIEHLKIMATTHYNFFSSFFLLFVYVDFFVSSAFWIVQFFVMCFVSVFFFLLFTSFQVGRLFLFSFSFSWKHQMYSLTCIHTYKQAQWKSEQPTTTTTSKSWKNHFCFFFSFSFHSVFLCLAFFVLFDFIFCVAASMALLWFCVIFALRVFRYIFRCWTTNWMMMIIC